MIIRLLYLLRYFTANHPTSHPQASFNCLCAAVVGHAFSRSVCTRMSSRASCSMRSVNLSPPVTIISQSFIKQSLARGETGVKVGWP